MFSEFDRMAMTRALTLAERGLETAHPNPRVGCVIAKNERIIAEGWHERTGEAHAEVAALRAAKEPVAGATAYVTLEPCSHHGRTPPCVNALIEARLARVVFAVQDPNPRVSGRGAEILLRAGIAVEAGLMEAEATEINIGFMKRMKQGLPWVRIKLAMSLDGRTALANGASQWITGEAARLDVQRWRARCSAVMTGVGTVLADDPLLNVRAPGFKGRQPLRVILDSYLRSPPGAKMFAGAPAAGKADPAAGKADQAAAKADPAAGGPVIVFAALGGGIPGAKGASAPAEPDSTGERAANVGGDMADLVKAFESRPTSVTAQPDEVARSAADGPESGIAPGAGGPGARSAVGMPAASGAHSMAASPGASGAHPVAATPAGTGAHPMAATPAGPSAHPMAATPAGPSAHPIAATPAGPGADSAAGSTMAPGAGSPLQTSPGAPVASRSRAPSPEVFEGRRSALLARGARIEEVPAEEGFLDLLAVLQRLAQLEVNEVLVEAGPTLAGQLLTTFFADELLLYIAPKLLGPQGRPLVSLPELQSLQDAWGFSLFDAKRFGDDLRLRLRPK